MVRRSGILIVAIGLTLVTVGCAQRVRRYPVNGTVCGNLVFNSQWNMSVDGFSNRSSWPSTGAYQLSTEQIEFRETVIDRQGRFGHSDDFLYRRFEQTRTGRGTR